MLQDPGINCSLGDALPGERNEQGVQVGAAGMAPRQGSAALGMETERINKISSVLSVNLKRSKSWFLTSKEIWGAGYCRIPWDPNSNPSL